MTDFEEIRLKDPGELSDEDKGVLKEHAEELTDDEKAIFKEVIAEEKKDDDDKKGFTFASQEEFDKAIAERTEKIIAEKEAAKEKERKDAEDKAKAEKEGVDERFFPEGYQAKDWNEAAKEMYPKFREKILKEQNEVRQKTQESIDRINQEFDEEIETIATEDKSIPAKGTKERETFDTELSQIGVEYQGVTNMTQAYKIWKALNTGKDKKDEDVSPKQRDLASKVGRSGGEGTSVKERTYRKLSGSSMDSLIEEQLADMGVK